MITWCIQKVLHIQLPSTFCYVQHSTTQGTRVVESYVATSHKHTHTHTHTHTNTHTHAHAHTHAHTHTHTYTHMQGRAQFEKCVWIPPTAPAGVTAEDPPLPPFVSLPLYVLFRTACHRTQAGEGAAKVRTYLLLIPQQLPWQLGSGLGGAIPVCTCVCTCTCVCVCVYVYVHVRVCFCVCACVWMYVHAYTCAYVMMCIAISCAVGHCLQYKIALHPWLLVCDRKVCSSADAKFRADSDDAVAKMKLPRTGIKLPTDKILLDARCMVYGIGIEQEISTRWKV